MATQTRNRFQNIQDQENLNIGRAKPLYPGPTKRPGLGVLREVNSNAQLQRDAAVGKIALGKVAATTAEYEKKNQGIRGNNYKYVQSKIDTGLANKPPQATKTTNQISKPLKREESAVDHTLRAVQSKALKESNLTSKSEVTELKLKRNPKNSTKTIQKPETKNVSKDKQINTQVENIRHLSLKDSLSPKLPTDIEDIDASDGQNPLLLTAYIKDIYKYLTHLENRFSIAEDHLSNQSYVTGHMRSVLVDWLVQVHIQFGLELETFQLTVGILDRYMQIVPDVKRNQLQLVGVAAMYIAAKYEEVYVPDVKDYVFVTDNAYTKGEIFKYERDIITKLKFCLARPIPLSFLRRFIKAANGSSKNHNLAKYFIDLCLVDYSMCHYKPSELAAAALCLSLHVLSNKKRSEVWTPTLLYYSGYSLSHIEPIMKKIAVIVDNVKKSKLKAVFEKYHDIKLSNVATLLEVQCASLTKLMSTPST